jgi:GTP-binding protein EngB required for normal cell division
MPPSGIDRKANNAFGGLGSLYDQHRDQVLERLDMKLKKPKQRKLKTVQCKLISGETNESQNLLRMIDIQDDLRLSILLNLVPKTGISLLIDYPYRITEYTRFLHYIYIRREEYLRDDAKKVRKELESSIHKTDATHIITGINWGIEFVAVLQLPGDAEMAAQIDTILNKMCTSLNDSKHRDLKLSPNKQNLLGEIKNTEVYSNIPALSSRKTIYGIYLDIDRLEGNKTEHLPVDFKLYPIQEISAQNHRNDNTLNSPSETCNNSIEQYLLQLSTMINYFESSLIKNVSNLLREHLKERLTEAYTKWLDIKNKYTDEMARMAHSVVNFRKDNSQLSEINEILNDERHRTLKNSCDELNENLKHLEVKIQFIADLQQQKFQYQNVAELNLGADKNIEQIEQILLKDRQRDRILCSSDTLKHTNRSKWDKLRRQLLGEHQKDDNLHLIYADFSYCTYRLSDIITLPLPKMNPVADIGTPDRPLQPTESTSVVTSPPSTDTEIINILLLGESGVGKSTFINAFANYLMFETLTTAESNKPVVIIPVSFFITTGDNFEERTVKFGDFDSSNNEDFDHPGQSVTQHCRSYLFDLSHNNGKRLRIIDTPGFGDTRGLDQDDTNMQHILEYINNLKHLNAVCFLLKPNMAQLNSCYRTCITQLTEFLGPSIAQNIIFGFTNSRCTFYTPGDTAPLLKAMLKSLTKIIIPFHKKNTFCFDSESFRYLVANQDSIPFNNLDRQEYENSWSTSMKQSHLLLDYICNSHLTYSVHDQLKSNIHAQLKIIHMIRPILETIRNILRNQILWNKDEKKNSIMLCPTAIKCPVTLCLLCERRTIEIANFSILLESPNKAQSKRRSCSCISSQRISIDYILKYKITENQENHDRKRMSNQLALLFNACTELAYFLQSITHSSNDNPFLVVLSRMIDDEKKICSDNKPTPFNVQLLDELETFKNKFESRMREMTTTPNNIELPIVYERIEMTRNYPGVQEQINAVEKSHSNMMKHYESKIPNNPSSDCDSVMNSFF